VSISEEIVSGSYHIHLRLKQEGSAWRIVSFAEMERFIVHFLTANPVVVQAQSLRLAIGLQAYYINL
jgi:hypothetical protein